MLVEIRNQLRAFRSRLNHDAFESLFAFRDEFQSLCRMNAQVDDIDFAWDFVKARKFFSHCVIGKMEEDES